MKLKKILLMGLSLALVAALAIGGTLAYLTDRDSKVNTFTVGDVEIELTENFKQGAELLPGVDIEKEVAIKNIGENDAWVWYTYAAPTALINTGANASLNVIHFNIPGRNWDTYRENNKYWEDGQTAAVPFEKTWHWEKMDIDALEKDGIKYTVVTVLYNGILESKDTTTLGLEKVYLDTHVDIDPEGNWYWVDNGNATDLNWNTEENGAPMIYVSAYAIQASGITDVNSDSKIDVNDAYAAYQKQWGENGAEYEDPTPAPAPVPEGATLVSDGLYQDADGNYLITEAAGFDGMREKVAGEQPNENDGTWKLYNDIDLKGVNWTPIAGFHGTFDGNGKTISNMNASFLAKNSIGGRDFGVVCNVKNVTFHKATITGTKCVGVVVGEAVGVTIEGVKVTEATVIGTEYVGGIVGYVYTTTSTITGCEVTGSTIKAEGNGANGKVGGIVGFIAIGKVTDNTVTGCTISGTKCIGGIAGRGGSGESVANIYGNTVSGNNVTGTDTATVDDQIGDKLNVKESE